MFFAGSGTTFREHQISHAHKYTHTRSKTRLISHSSIIIFRFWAPAVFLAPTVRLFFRRKKKRHSGASFQRFYLLPLANCSFPYSSHPLDFLSFLQKIFTAIFLQVILALFASCWAEIDHQKNRTSSCLFVGRGQLASFQIQQWGFLSYVSLHSRKLFTCRNSTALFPTCKLLFSRRSRFSYSFKTFSLLSASVRAARKSSAASTRQPQKKQRSNLFFLTSHFRPRSDTREL